MVDTDAETTPQGQGQGQGREPFLTLLVIVLAILVPIVALLGVRPDPPPAPPDGGDKNEEQPTGDPVRIRVCGSASVTETLLPAFLKNVLKLTARPTERERTVYAGVYKHTLLEVEVIHGETGKGVELFNQGACEVAMASSVVDLPGPIPLAIDALVVIANENNGLGLNSLSAEDIRALLGAGVVPSAAQHLNLYARTTENGTTTTNAAANNECRGPSSGTMGEVVAWSGYTGPVVAKRCFSNSEQIIQAVAQDPLGIGIINLPATKMDLYGVKTLAVYRDSPDQEQRPNPESLQLGHYELWRWLYAHVRPGTHATLASELMRALQQEHTTVVGVGLQPLSAMRSNSFPDFTSCVTGEHLPRQLIRLMPALRFAKGDSTLEWDVAFNMRQITLALVEVDQSKEYLYMVAGADVDTSSSKANCDKALARLRSVYDQLPTGVSVCGVALGATNELAAEPGLNRTVKFYVSTVKPRTCDVP